MGRPSIPPSLSAKVMLLQHRTGLAMSRRSSSWQSDLRSKIAFGVRRITSVVASDVVDEVSRSMLLHGRDGSRSRTRCVLAEELGMLDGTAEQMIDSTPMVGAAAAQDTVRLIRHGVKIVDAVPAVDRGAGGRSRTAGVDHGGRMRSRMRGGGSGPSANGADADRAGRRAALEAVEQDAGRLDDERAAAAHGLVRELIGRTSRSTRPAFPGCIAAPARAG